VSRAPLPPGLLTVGELLPRRPYSTVRINGQLRPPPDWRPALTPFPGAPELWLAVRRGEFPAPVRGPWGVAWSLDDVQTWRRRRGLT
jgi:hypothetical protein